jgi:hypothetical protein
MAFKLEGEVVIDGRKGTTALKDLQREANKTSDTFRRAGGNTERLGKSLLSLGLNAGRAGTSLGALSRLGAGGLFGAAVLGSINKFGETVKQASTDYYSAQKDLADAFETSFKSTSIEQAQAGLEKTQDTIERLRGETTQLGPLFSRLGKNIESLSGISLGIGSREKSLKQANQELILQEDILKLRQSEKKDKEARERAESQIKFDKMVFYAEEKLEKSSDERRKKSEQEITERRISNINSVLREEMYNIDETSRLQEAKDKTRFDRLMRDLYRRRAEEKKRPEQAQEAGGGLLGASRAGQQALDVARKVRAREVNREDFRTQDQVFQEMADKENAARQKRSLLGGPMEGKVSAQDMRNKVAAQQAAGEMPLLSEKLGAMQGTTPASQIAAEKAKGGGGVDMQKQLLEAIKALSEQIPAAVATG